MCDKNIVSITACKMSTIHDIKKYYYKQFNI